MDSQLSDNVRGLIATGKVSFSSFFAGFDFGRGLFSDRKDSPHIVSSRDVLVWKVIEDNLEDKNRTKVLFDGENYVIEWYYDYVLQDGGKINEASFCFHWKGMNALKGFSPLPSERDVIVDRIYQWGEPPIFFHIFPEKLIVLGGKEENFKPNIPHLFMLRGELINEIHLYEIQCAWKNFRSRAVFFIVAPDKKTVYMWVGSHVEPSFVTMVINLKQLITSVRNIHESWKDLQFLQVNEGQPDLLKVLQKEILGECKDYFSMIDRDISSFTPRLFYLILNENEINPVEIQYPLGDQSVVSPFPFVQSHLYTAAQPGIFTCIFKPAKFIIFLFIVKLHGAM